LRPKETYDANGDRSFAEASAGSYLLRRQRPAGLPSHSSGDFGNLGNYL
jgi:hypothetical protein